MQRRRFLGLALAAGFASGGLSGCWSRPPLTFGIHHWIGYEPLYLARDFGWLPESVLEEGVVPTEAGRWLYRVAAKGKQDGTPVVQTFHLLAGPNGDQVTVSVLVALEKAEKLGARDVALVNAIEFKK